MLERTMSQPLLSLSGIHQSFGYKKVLDDVSSEELGVVHDFYDNGQQVILVLKLKESLADLIFLDQFVPVVDIEGGFIRVNLPEYID